MHRDTILLRRAAEQKPDAVGERETLPLGTRKVALRAGESRRFELVIRASRQIEDCDTGLSVAGLEAGKTGARLHVCRGLEADPQARREYRLTKGNRGDARQSDPGDNWVNEKPTPHA